MYLCNRVWPHEITTQPRMFPVNYSSFLQSWNFSTSNNLQYTIFVHLNTYKHIVHSTSGQKCSLSKIYTKHKWHFAREIFGSQVLNCTVMFVWGEEHAWIKYVMCMCTHIHVYVCTFYWVAALITYMVCISHFTISLLLQLNFIHLHD